MDSPVPSTRSRRARRKINYFQEKLDTQFVDYPGLTRLLAKEAMFDLEQ